MVNTIDEWGNSSKKKLNPALPQTESALGDTLSAKEGSQTDQAKESSEKRWQLAYYPIFRGNALYNAMFPEITPLYQAGEDPDAEVILEEILKHPWEKVILDKTLSNELYRSEKLTEEYLKHRFPAIEMTMESNNETALDTKQTLKSIFKLYDISIHYSTIDNMIHNNLSWGEDFNVFSSQDAKNFVSLITAQVPNVDRVIIALNNISDHMFSPVGEYFDNQVFQEKREERLSIVNMPEAKTLLKEVEYIARNTRLLKRAESIEAKDEAKDKIFQKILKQRNIPLPDGLVSYGNSDDSNDNIMKMESTISTLPTDIQKDIAEEISQTIEENIDWYKKAITMPAILLKQEIKNQLNVDIEFVLNDIDLSTIDENTAIIKDRHNRFSDGTVLEEVIPQQTILMPFSSGLQHAEKIGAIKVVDENLETRLRRFFEGKE